MTYVLFVLLIFMGRFDIRLFDFVYVFSYVFIQHVICAGQIRRILITISRVLVV